jgi:hypothetical protein
MNPELRLSQTHSFTIRLWSEQLDDDTYEWRGRLQHMDSGERRYFRDAESLYGALLNILADADPRLLAEKET